MRGLKRLLDQEYDRLKKIVQISRKKLEGLAEGTLRVSKSNNCIQFYHCFPMNHKGTYIPSGNEELVSQLARKSYYTKTLRLAEKRARQLEKLVKNYKDDEMERIYYKEHPAKRKFVEPVEPTWEQVLQEWKQIPYTGKKFWDDSQVILTEKGERVRSKTEKIMADYFYHHGIEYKYECPLLLKDGRVVYPDFTFLSPKTYEEIYWEHNGMMGEHDYTMSAVKKILSYEASGIYSGERLILTYEGDQMVLSVDKIEELVNRYLV